LATITTAIARGYSTVKERLESYHGDRRVGKWFDVSVGPSSALARCPVMISDIEAIRLRMEAAAQALDFEEAKRLRDQLNLMRGGATLAEAEASDTSDLTRQQPGAMGLGTSQQRMTPPKGWKPPPKPDPMTRGKGRR